MEPGATPCIAARRIDEEDSMRPNKVKQFWQEKKPLAVGWLGTPDTYVVETMANSGFDALVLDMQHGMAIGPDRAALALQAISTTDTTPMVRVPWNDPIYIQYVLDAGAYGVIVPMVNTRAEAEKAAGATKYFPLGYRSNGANRARFFARQRLLRARQQGNPLLRDDRDDRRRSRIWKRSPPRPASMASTSARPTWRSRWAGAEARP